MNNIGCAELIKKLYSGDNMTPFLSINSDKKVQQKAVFTKHYIKESQML